MFMFFVQIELNDLWEDYKYAIQRFKKAVSGIEG